MIENNPTNVEAAFEMLQAKIDQGGRIIRRP